MAQIRIAPNTANELVIEPDETVVADFTKTHTGFSDFRYQVQAGLGLNNNALDEIWLEEDDGTLLFRGQLQKIDEQDKPPLTTISGPGPGYKLEQSETVFTVSNELAHTAIERFWNNETPFSPTVTTPSINNTITGESVQEADTNAEFNDIVTLADTDPLAVRNTNIELLQSCFTTEAEDGNNNGATETNADYSDGEGITLLNTGDFVEITFTTEYVIPQEDFSVQVRVDTGNDANPIDVILDGTTIGQFNFANNDLSWFDATSQISLDSDLSTGSHTLRFEVASDGNSGTIFDVIAPFDGRFTYTFDNTVNASSGYLDGPELYPDAFEVAFADNSTSWNITDGSISSTWDDTSNNQRIQLRLASQTWFPNDGTEDNTSSITTDFGSEVGSSIQGRATLSRYGSTTGQTPLTGINGQHLQSWEITFDGNDRPVFEGENFEGTDLEVAQQLHQRADMRFTLEHEKSSLPVESYRPEDNVKALPALDVINETTRTDYGSFANHVTVRGQTEDGDRLSHTVQDDASVNDIGEIHHDVIDPSLKSLVEIKVTARAILREKLRERDDKGEKEVTPIDIAPGYGRTSPFGGDDTPIEEVSYRISNGRLNGRLVFDFRTGMRLASDIGGLRNKGRNNSLGF